MPIDNSSLVARVKVVGTIFDEECLNVFYYGNADGSGVAADLLSALGSSLVAGILSVTSSSYRCLSLQYEEVKGGTGFGTLSINSVGTISGDCLPPYVSWDFTLIRGGVGERNGYKRFAGVAESSQVDGVATTGISSSLQSLANSIADTQLSGTAAWVPLIRRTRVHRVPQNPPVYYSFTSAEYAKIGSQNSRKFGHGR